MLLWICTIHFCKTEKQTSQQFSIWGPPSLFFLVLCQGWEVLTLLWLSQRTIVTTYVPSNQPLTIYGQRFFHFRCFAFYIIYLSFNLVLIFYISNRFFWCRVSVVGLNLEILVYEFYASFKLICVTLDMFCNDFVIQRKSMQLTLLPVFFVWYFISTVFIWYLEIWE